MSESPPTKQKGSAKQVESEVSALRSEVDQLRHQLDQLSNLQARSGQMSIKVLEALEGLKRARVAPQNGASDPEDIRAFVRESLREELEASRTSAVETAPAQAPSFERSAPAIEPEQNAGRRSLWINVGLVLIFIAVVAIGYPIVSPWFAQVMQASSGLAGLTDQAPDTAGAAGTPDAGPEGANLEAGAGEANSDERGPETTELETTDPETADPETADPETTNLERQPDGEKDPVGEVSSVTDALTDTAAGDSKSTASGDVTESMATRATPDSRGSSSNRDTSESRSSDSKLSLRTGRPLLIEPEQTSSATEPRVRREFEADKEAAPEPSQTEARLSTNERTAEASAAGPVVGSRSNQEQSTRNDQSPSEISTEVSDGGDTAPGRADVAEELLGAIDTTQSAPLEEQQSEDATPQSPDLTLQQASVGSATAVSSSPSATETQEARTAAPGSPPASVEDAAAPQERGEAPQRFAIEVGKEIQKNLKTLGFYVGSVDGLVGPNTISAIRNFKLSIGRDPASELTPEEIAILAQTADRLRSN